MKKTRIGITVVGKDREGTVAAFTNMIFNEGGNVEKISQNVVKGVFGMYLEASFVKKNSNLENHMNTLAKKFKMDTSAHYETSERKNVAIFVTKESHCLDAILNVRKNLKCNISVIIGTEKTLAPKAKKAGVPFILISDREQEKAELNIITTCKKYAIDLILLARYMRILTPNFVWRYPNRIINIHPSLLPAFPGAAAYTQAFERGTKMVGVTAHYVTENLDQGPIILQNSFNVKPEDALEIIKKRGQKLEAVTLLNATKLHINGKTDVRWRKVHIKK
ncbi:MAG: formyl transferase domain-containing protein [Cenarchaeum symbiont of Oopsacas minuta]|nr:formyl transferase domain-containing protein [Cenarchaeum symbiont of Oopsacas minuta]